LGWQLAQTLAGRSRIEYLRQEQGADSGSVVTRAAAEEDCRIHHRIWRSEAVRDTAETWELCLQTVIGRSTCKKRTDKAAASARVVRECSAG